MPEAPAADRLTGAMLLRPSAMSDDARPRPRPLMRRYEAVYLDESGHVADVNRIAPATPFFEEAFSRWPGAPWSRPRRAPWRSRT